MSPDALRALIADWALVVLLAVALYTDIRYEKIYNAWTFPNMAAGLCLNMALPSRPQLFDLVVPAGWLETAAAGTGSDLTVAVSAKFPGLGTSPQVVVPAISWLGGLLFSFEGLLLALALMYIPFHLHFFGAGDVKLLMAIGAFKGPDFILWTFFFFLAFGSLLSLTVMVKRGILAARMLNAYNEIYYKTFGSRSLDETPADGKIYYAPAIAAGVLAAWIKFRG